MDFLELKNESFGLDISDFSLKIVKLKKKGNFLNLASFNEDKIEPGVIRKGEIRKPDRLAEIIKKTIKEAKGKKLRTNRAIVSLSEEKSFVQVIKMPRLSPEDLKSAVVFEAENHIPLSIEEVYLSYQVISLPKSHSDQLDVLVAAFPKRIIDSYIDCLKKANVKPIALETESLAISRALVKKEKANQPVLLIDFGANRTIFIIYAGGSVRFIFVIPVSSYGFSEAISQAMEINLAKAEEMKVRHGLVEKIKLQMENGRSTKSLEKSEIFEALIPALTDLIEQIKKYLNYYQTHVSRESLPANGEKIEKVLICGGGAKLKGLTSFLSSELKIPVQIGNPWVNVLPGNIQPKEQTLIQQKEESLNYTTALGLALRGIREK